MTNRRRLLNAYGGLQEIVHSDDNEPDKLIIETRQDCTAELELARELRDLTPDKDLRHAARIPQFVLDKAFREGWINDAQKWRDWANDPDNRMFRTWPGKL